MSSVYLDNLKMLLNKCKFVCLTHSETKQTKMLESGAERLAAGSGRESRQFVLQRLKLSHGFDGRVFIGTIWGEGCRCGTVF